MLANLFLDLVCVVVGPQWCFETQKVGPPKSNGARRVGRAQNFALFFPLPPSFSLFCLSLVSSRGFLVVVGSAGAVKCARLEFSRRPRSRRGFTRQPESPNMHISGTTASKTPRKFHEKTTRERQKERKWPPFVAPPFWAPPFWAPPFGPHPPPTR